MNEHGSFEREVAAWIASEGAGSAPAQPLDDILLATSRTRPMPTWLAIIKEPPMRISSRLTVGSPAARVAVILAATLLLSGLVAGAGIAGSRLFAADGAIVVDQNDPSAYQTITEAVEAAEAGDTILVRAGVYREAVTITEDITLRGDGPREEIILESDAQSPTLSGFCGFEGPYGVVLDDSAAEVSNLTLRNPSGVVHLIVVLGGAPLLDGVAADQVSLPDGPIGSSLCFDGGSRGTIRDSLLDTVFVEAGSPSTIDDNTIRGWTIINPSGPRGSAEDPTIVTRNHVQGVTFNGPVRVVGNVFALREGEEDLSATDTDEEWFWGLNIHGGRDWTVEANSFEGFAIGIDVSLGAEGRISGNDLSDNATGIRLRDAAVLDGNTITGGSDGIRVESGGSAAISDNRIAGAQRGIAIEGAANPTLSGNVLCGNADNLFMAETSGAIVADDNEVCADGLVADR